jgi:hypothetical protein
VRIRVLVVQNPHTQIRRVGHPPRSKRAQSKNRPLHKAGDSR